MEQPHGHGSKDDDDTFTALCPSSSLSSSWLMTIWNHPVRRSTTYALILLAWLKYFFLSPLRAEAFDMHERQMDPTEMVLVPYDLQRLGIYVLGTTFFSIITTTDNDLIFIKTILIVQWTAICFVAMIICGASWHEHAWHSLAAALHVVTLSSWDPTPIFFDETTRRRRRARPPFRENTAAGATTAALIVKQYHYHNRLFLERFSLEPASRQQRPRDSQEWLSTVIAHFVMAVTIPLQILRLYDWGMQIQRWPVPAILGASTSWALALIFGTPLVLLLDDSYSDNKSKTSRHHDD